MPGKSAKGKRGGKKGGRKARGRRQAKAGNTPEWASCSVKRTILPVGNNPYQTNNIYSVENVSLSQFQRAATIAQAYQFYRISNVKLTLKFPVDTFAIGTNTYSRPDLYYIIDKAGALGAVTTLEMLKQMGARPRACDNKPTTITWKPSVLTEVESTVGGALASQYKLSPWLNTASDTVAHRGVFWFLDQYLTGQPPAVFPYVVELEVQFQFKKPLWQASEPGARPFQTLVDGWRMATLDNSSDGILDHRNVGLSAEEIVIVPNPI